MNYIISHRQYNFSKELQKHFILTKSNEYFIVLLGKLNQYSYQKGGAVAKVIIIINRENNYPVPDCNLFE